MTSRLRSRLDGLRRGLRTAADEAVRQAAFQALSDARQCVPVKTGRLRGSLLVREEEGAAAVTTDCPYAAAVELGSSRHAPQPFLVPAAEAQRAEFPRIAAELARRIF